MLFVILLLTLSFVFNFGSELPVILVNRVELKISNVIDTKGNKLNIATYNYFEGETVDVICMRPDESYNYDVTIKDVKELNEIFKIDELSSHNGVGLRTTLKSTHNNLTFTCTLCLPNKDIFKVTIKFALQNTFDDTIDLKINDIPVRNIKTDDINNMDINCKYYYLNSENITVTAQSKSDDVMLTEHEECNNESEKSKQFQWSKTPQNGLFLRYKAYDQGSQDPQKTVTITFKMLPYWYLDDVPLSMNISRNKILLNVYSFSGYQYIIYGFEEDENVTLNCSTTVNLKHLGYFLHFVNDVRGDTTSLTTKKHLRSNPNITITLECNIFVSQSSPLKTKRRITVYFQKSTAISNTPSEMFGTNIEGGAFPYWILLVVGGVICVTICFYFVTKKMKQRNLSIQRLGHHPVIQRVEDLYSQPSKAKTENNQTTLELNYAVLDLAPSEHVSKNIDSESTLYAEISTSRSVRHLRSDDRI